MKNKVYCSKCSKLLKQRYDIYISQNERSKYYYMKLCKRCFEIEDKK